MTVTERQQLLGESVEDAVQPERAHKARLDPARGLIAGIVSSVAQTDKGTINEAEALTRIRAALRTYEMRLPAR